MEYFHLTSTGSAVFRIENGWVFYGVSFEQAEG
jgi:hypothetical protein